MKGMKDKRRDVMELEDELLRLNALVRNRRAQLDRLEKCPNKDCQCRLVWRDVMERTLSRQMGKIRRQVAMKAAANNGKVSAPRRSKAAPASRRARA